MPYTNLSDLPGPVKEMGVHEQKIWQSSYNRSYQDYKRANDKKYDPDKSESDNRERYAASVAWAAVNAQRGVRNAN
jgi:cation transport regulator ChaB